MYHTFEIKLPSAKEVYVAGSFNNWQKIPMKFSKAKQVWYAKVNLKKGRHEYKFFVDGTWIPDPIGEKTINPFGTENSVIVI
jgi:1,4-alpha-glucan branching enzyme